MGEQITPVLQAPDDFTKEPKRSRLKFENKPGEQLKTFTKSYFEFTYIRNHSRTKDVVAPLRNNALSITADDYERATSTIELRIGVPHLFFSAQFVYKIISSF